MSGKVPIYLDYNASTPVDERVLQKMLPYFCEKFGNPSSAGHYFGWEAQAAIEIAKEQILAALGAQEEDSLIFTSGATESNNLVLKGLAHSSTKPAHFISQKTEHSSILQTLNYLKTQGHEITLLEVDAEGFIDLNQLKESLRENTLCVSIMQANNEIGTLQPIEEIGKILKNHPALLHTDAAQSFTKVPLEVTNWHIDLLSLSGHKMLAPKGIGALYLSKKAKKHPLTPLIHGGGHQDGLRSGTLNVPAIVGLGEAAFLGMNEQPQEFLRQSGLRNKIIQTLINTFDFAVLNGSLTHRLPGNANISFEGIKASDILRATPELALSTGSACATGKAKPSHVLEALGHSPKRMESAVRISIGHWTSEEEIDRALAIMTRAIKQLI